MFGRDRREASSYCPPHPLSVSLKFNFENASMALKFNFEKLTFYFSVYNFSVMYTHTHTHMHDFAK